jgi:hypothetical protein
VGSPQKYQPRRRLRRPRAPRDTFSGFEPMEHSPYTWEGRIEQTARFGRSVNRARGWRRWVGKAVFLGALVWIGVALVMTVGLVVASAL